MIIEAGGPKAVHSSARIEPKYTHYAPHGCGWDSYIIVNNGGLLPCDGMLSPQTGYVPKQQSTMLLVN
jgi:hypothetical protein